MLWFHLLLSLHVVAWRIVASEPRQCQSITYYECKNIGYNQTYLPNKFNHQDQKDVALVVRAAVESASIDRRIRSDVPRQVILSYFALDQSVHRFDCCWMFTGTALSSLLYLHALMSR